jgi:hypothetical protein
MNPGAVDIAYRFDAETQQWVQVLSGDTIAAGEAVHLLSNTSHAAVLNASPAETASSQELHAGWNFIGLMIDPFEPGGTSSMPADEALESVHPDYTMVVGTREIEGSDEQFIWEPSDLENIPSIEGWLGYWVFMGADRTLQGFSSTPVDWPLDFAVE